MASRQGFAPRWASPPGETIRTTLQERDISIEDFAKMMEAPRSTIDGLLAGEESISIQLARQLSQALGASVEFWMTRDCQYHDDLARLEADQWVKTLPLNQMARFGWIPWVRDWQERAVACLEFFDVSDVDAWNSRYRPALQAANFRAPEGLPLDIGATSVWLRQAEREAEQLCDRGPWRADRFEKALTEIRGLTKIKDPQRFVPLLIELCAKAGVAVVVLPAPAGCPASGAARHLPSGHPLIQLSARYLADDHFWFTFFHEAGHVLLHDPHIPYIDQLTLGERAMSQTEEEANDFATGLLIPSALRAEVFDRSRVERRDVLRLAGRCGISPGILVGQMQHAGTVKFSDLNYLKRRYKWRDATLEIA